jgi:hypothetical protein
VPEPKPDWGPVTQASVRSTEDEAFLEWVVLYSDAAWELKKIAAKKIKSPERGKRIAFGSPCWAYVSFDIFSVEMIRDIAFFASELESRRQAIRLLTDDRYLLKIVEEEELFGLREEAVRRLQSKALRRHFMLHSDNESVRGENIRTETDCDTLAETAASDPQVMNRIRAVDRLLGMEQSGSQISQAQWFTIARSPSKFRDNESLRCVGSFMPAVSRLTDPEMLTTLVLTSIDRWTRNLALERLDSPKYLARVREESMHEELRRAAGYKLGEAARFPKIVVWEVDDKSVPVVDRLRWEGIPELHCLSRSPRSKQLRDKFRNTDYVVLTKTIHSPAQAKVVLTCARRFRDDGIPCAAVVLVPKKEQDDKKRARLHRLILELGRQTDFILPMVYNHEGFGAIKPAAEEAVEAIQALLSPLYGGMEPQEWKLAAKALGPIADYEYKEDACNIAEKDGIHVGFTKTSEDGITWYLKNEGWNKRNVEDEWLILA